jgi:hypothetical protein
MKRLRTVILSMLGGMLVLVIIANFSSKEIPDQQILFANRWNEMAEQNRELKGIRVSVRKADALQVTCENSDLCVAAYTTFATTYSRLEGFEAAGFTEIDFEADDNAFPKEFKVMKLVEMDKLLNSK